MESNLTRFANLIQLTNQREDKIWTAVKKIKFLKSPSQAFLRKTCVKGGLYNQDHQEDLQLTLEKVLKTNSTDRKLKNMTADKIRISAKMFLYLNVCPSGTDPERWFRSWLSYYRDLFLTHPAEKIILTLNRMMKTKRSEEDKLRAKKLMRRTSNLLSLNFERIQSLLPDTYRNASVKVLEGAQFNNL